jgi:hypothetical protein
MKELSLSVSTGQTGVGGETKDNTVVLTAKFATHDEAVAFHDQLGRLAASASKSNTGSTYNGLKKLIGNS